LDSNTKKWWEIIFKLVNDFEENNIKYSFDASTSLFVHGINGFEMDDLDIMIQWDQFETVHQMFKKYSPSPTNHKRGFWHFRFYIDDREVHIMSSEQIKDLEEDPERVNVDKDDKKIWSKSIHFYRRYTNDYYLQKLIDDFIVKTKLEN